jgi:hypothetical protein
MEGGEGDDEQSEEDEWHHSRTSYVKYGTNDPKIIQTMVTSPFWIKREPRKHRYVYILTKDKKERKAFINSLKHEVFPYPKVELDIIDEVHKMDPINLEISN